MSDHDIAFQDARKNIEPDEDAKNAKKAHAEVREVLEADSRLEELGVDTILIGSYGRDVSIKRVKDVDVFMRLNEADDELDAGAILQTVFDVLNDEYELVTPQERSIKVALKHYDLAVDAVPARPHQSHWEIPNGDGTWIETNPLRLGELTTALNKQYTLGGGDQGAYVPTVKLVRQIRRALGIERPSGFYFEILGYWAFKSGNIDDESQARYLTSCLRQMCNELDTALRDGLADPTLDNAYITTRATRAQLASALEKLRQAASDAEAALEEEEFCPSALMWQNLLGKDSYNEWVFRMPSTCNDDGTAKKNIAIPGETRAPRGNDRFA